ncbi:MAG TPA: DciA family protein [Patescibacteria group bacterium]|nr:DciA family protein [Patescibacteria group bacterium]
MVEKIKDTVQQVMHQWEARQRAQPAIDPQALLEKIVAKRELPHVGVAYFRNGILGIKVDSSARLYNLNMQKEQLLTRLRAYAKTAVKDIRFSIGEIK